MTSTMLHRGPDAGDVWQGEGVALGHRRLAIIDLTAAGAQPMTSHNRRWVVVFNGEIYNHLDIRPQLQRPWRGHSDTETLIEAISEWGVEEALRRIKGMFAFAAWDTHARKLVLARDRMGEKPLYYAKCGKGWLFASEIRAFAACREWAPSVEHAAVAHFVQYNVIGGTRTIWSEARKVAPGAWVELSPESTAWPETRIYWSTEQVAREGSAAPLRVTADEAAERLHQALRLAVRRQLISDVPIGAFLSGGIDSSLVAALMRKEKGPGVRTFTIGFREAQFDESGAAEAVARHLGTDHTTMFVSADDALAEIPKLSETWDEPFADSSQIPTLLLCRLTRQHVTVSLSGDAGDELFGGYNRYIFTRNTWPSLRKYPTLLRRMAAAGATSIPPRLWDRLLSERMRLRRNITGDRIHKLASVLDVGTPDDVYHRATSQWSPSILAGAERFASHKPRLEMSDPVQAMQLLDQCTYLPDDILTKVDRAAMQASLETRVPYLDPDVVSLAWHIPTEYQLREGKGKWLLRKVLRQYVPDELIERPKVGFGIPLADWLRGPLAPWANDLLSEASLRSVGLINPASVLQKWREHQTGQRNWQYHLWTILMLQSWAYRWLKR